MPLSQLWLQLSKGNNLRFCPASNSQCGDHEFESRALLFKWFRFKTTSWEASRGGNIASTIVTTRMGSFLEPEDKHLLFVKLDFEIPQVYADLARHNWNSPRQTFHERLKALMDAGLGKRLMFGSDEDVWPEAIVVMMRSEDPSLFDNSVALCSGR